MRTRILITAITLLMAISVSAQPPRIREEARRLTNHVDRAVGLSRGQYEEIYRINLRFAAREISIDRRDRAYRRVMSDRQWFRWTDRRPGPPPPRRDVRPGPSRPPRDVYRGAPRRDYRSGPAPRRDNGPRRDVRPDNRQNFRQNGGQGNRQNMQQNGNQGNRQNMRQNGGQGNRQNMQQNGNQGNRQNMRQNGNQGNRQNMRQNGNQGNRSRQNGGQGNRQNSRQNQQWL